MRRDNEKLTIITKRTYDRLQNDAVIMPSDYYEAFINEAKMLENSEIKNDKDLSGTIKMLKKVEHELFGEESTLFHTVETLKAELSLLRKQFFADTFTNAYNTSWLYQHKLHEATTFKDNGCIVSIKMNAYDAIINEYGENTVETMTRNLCDYIIKDLHHAHLEYDIVHFRANHFLLFVYDTNEEDLAEYMTNLDHAIVNHTFKFRHKVFSLSIEYALMEYINNESFLSLLDQLEEELLKKNIMK